MNKKSVAAWFLTLGVALPNLGSGVAYLVGAAPLMEALAHLGYSASFATLLGGWKILGSLALIVPVPARLREWAYAGYFFTLTGAAYSHVAAGDGLAGAVFPLIMTGMLVGSHILRQPEVSIGTAAPQPA